MDALSLKPGTPLNRFEFWDHLTARVGDKNRGVAWGPDCSVYLFELVLGEATVAGVELDMLHIHRKDGAPMGWDELQAAKNEIAPSRDAFQLFPSEADTINHVNMYHIFLAPPGERVPWCFDP